MNIQFEDLVKMIESLAGRGAIEIGELESLLEGAFNQPIDLNLLQNALETLQEKYSQEFYGIEFCYQEGYTFFRSRPVDQLLAGRYLYGETPIDL